MDKKQFRQRLKQIYSQTKRGPHDSSLTEIISAFEADVTGKSKGGWDESIAAKAIRFAEHIFSVQPEATQLASKVKADDSEAELERFLNDRKYSYAHIPESSEQTPDGRIEGFDSEYLCEIKSPLLIFDHKAAPFGYKHSTTHNKILYAIHKAKKQLEKLDPKHELPHILVYTSAHPQLNYSSLIDALKGYIAAHDGTIITDLRRTDIFKNTQSIIEDIDLYIWFQIGHRKRFVQASYFNNKTSDHADAINDLVDRLRLAPVSSMDTRMDIQTIRGSK